ncbi:hypothetical protein [Agrobacterium vitis]|uniref:hypothetical protein n=1 Tax=Agrobacterium vitis TaxID=373 RepID=UPI0012E90C2E|nr:hypothetical protein [Agrobacterium vitis]MVA61551.1 hypothetical protein [Agrobacterium vitis]
MPRLDPLQDFTHNPQIAALPAGRDLQLLDRGRDRRCGSLRDIDARGKIVKLAQLYFVDLEAFLDLAVCIAKPTFYGNPPALQLVNVAIGLRPGISASVKVMTGSSDTPINGL